jgi:glycosyltransferase involved in cell wall biosynthesis
VTNHNGQYGSLRVLFLALELETWQMGKGHTYPVGIGLEEGLKAQGVQYLTLNNFCLNRARKFLAGKRFDQVWVHVYPGNPPAGAWEWIAELAPIRVGLVVESLQYSSEELSLNSFWPRLKAYVRKSQDYLTHMVACDEKDVEMFNREGRTPALWWPQAVPERFIQSDPPAPRYRRAMFTGSLYPQRVPLLGRADLSGLLMKRSSPEKGTFYPALFDSMQVNIRRYLRRTYLPAHRLAITAYLHSLRALRRRCFFSWLRSIQTAAAVVNLPHWVKTYSGRVVESMAAGRPVVSWEIPERPRNRSLFQHDEEILLYPAGEPTQLAEQLRRVLADRALGARLVRNARNKVKRFHTVEHRVRQILDWLTAGATPAFN